jgi:hypothetical protein
MSARLVKNTNSVPDSGSIKNWERTNVDRPLIPLRPSTRLVAITPRTPIHSRTLLTAERDEQQAGVHVLDLVDPLALALALAHVERWATVFAGRDDELYWRDSRALLPTT